MLYASRLEDQDCVPTKPLKVLSAISTQIKADIKSKIFEPMKEEQPDSRSEKIMSAIPTALFGFKSTL